MPALVNFTDNHLENESNAGLAWLSCHKRILSINIDTQVAFKAHFFGAKVVML